MSIQHTHWSVAPSVRTGLYLMTKPDEPAGRALHRAALQARGREGLSGRATDWDRLHVTLVPFAMESDWLHQSRTIEAALDDLDFAEFRASLDRLFSFGGGGRFPLVPTADDGVIGFLGLRDALVATLDRRGVQHFASRSFTPHVTLLRDPKIVGQTFIEPVSWTVRSVQLVLSFVGTRQHMVLAERKLTALAEDDGSA